MSGFVGLIRAMERMSRPLGSDDDRPLPETPHVFEPPLNSSERVALRQLIEERFGDQTSPAGHGPAGNGPAGVSGNLQASAPAGHPDDVWAEWIGNAVATIREVLTKHQPHPCLGTAELLNCGKHAGYFADRQEWSTHIALIIAKALATQPK